MPQTVTRPGEATARLAVTSAVAARVRLEAELYSPYWQNIMQRRFDDQDFAPGQTRTYDATWLLGTDAAPGRYTVKLAIYSPDGRTRYHYNERAVQFEVR